MINSGTNTFLVVWPGILLHHTVGLNTFASRCASVIWVRELVLLYETLEQNQRQFHVI